MDQTSENRVLAANELTSDPEEDSRKGNLWPVLIVAGVLCICAVILLWPTGISLVAEAGTRSQPSSTSDPAQKTVTQRQPLTYYHQVIPGGLFSAPQPPVPQPKHIPPQSPARKPPLPAPPMPVARVNPYADWVYAGTVKRGGLILALLENTKSKEGQYVVAGDNFQNALVESITEQRITLRAAGNRYTIPKSEAASAISLDKNAPYLGNGAGGQPGAAAPPYPGAPPTPPAQAQSNKPEDGDANAEQTTESSDQ